MRVRRGSPGAFHARLRFAPGRAVAPAVCAAPLAATALLVASASLALPPAPAAAQSLRPFPPPFELPFVRDAFDLLGFCRQGPAGPCEMHEPETRRGETPMRDQLIRFSR